MSTPHFMYRKTRPAHRAASGVTALVCLVAQLAVPFRAEAAPLGSSASGGGSSLPPSISAIQNFQPDLFTGRATTAIPLAVPPGRRGLQPALALSYSSTGRNSWVGVGWSLDLGYIERSTKDGAPNYSLDKYSFLIQGVQSELVTAPGGTYRAKDEGLFLKFEKTATGWTVWDKAGTRYLFGQSTAARVINPTDATKIFRWHLDKVIDVFGNNMTVSYTKDGNQCYPDTISYTGFESPAQSGFAEVKFVLDTAARPDVEVSYRPGFELRTAKRLKQIETRAKVGSVLQPARRYDLVYTLSGRTSRSLLTSVRTIGSNFTSATPTCLPKTVFGYQGSSNPTYQMTSTSSTSVAQWNVRVAPLQQGDVYACSPNENPPWEPTVVGQNPPSIDGVDWQGNSDGSFSVTLPHS